MNNKINIIEGDTIEFLERESLAKEMLPIYLKFLLIEQRRPQTKFRYWLEEDLHRDLETTWIALLKNFICEDYKEKQSHVLANILRMQNLKTVEDIKRFIIAPKNQLFKNGFCKIPKKYAIMIV